jgi:PAS domain S-box-containing protein
MIICSHATPPLTILFVEDDADTREVLGTVIARRYPGLQLRTADNGRRGIDSFREHPADVILTDISMPVMDGLEMAAAIRALDPDVPIVFLTAYNDSRYLMEAIRIGSCRYVLKPIEYQHLFEAIDDSLATIVLERQVAAQNACIRKLSRVVEESPGMVVITGADFAIEYVNPALTAISGYTPEEVIGRNPLMLTATADAPESPWSSAISDEERHGVFLLRKKSGDEYWVKASISPLRNETGILTHFITQMTDITDLIQAEEELARAKEQLELRVTERTSELAQMIRYLQEQIVEREAAQEALRTSEHKYRTLFEDSKDAIYFVGVNGKLMDINPAGIDLFGFPRDELFDMDFTGELHVSGIERETFQKALFATHFVKEFETELRRRNGDTLHVLKTATVIHDDRGKIIGYQAIVHDITARKQLEQQLLQSQKMDSIGLLAGGVAHDFNNLMTAVLGYGQFIQDHVPGDNEMLRTCIGEILEAAGRATELTKSLLAFSRKQIINPKPVSLNDVIINVTKLLRRLIGEDIELSTSLTAGNLMIMADSGQIDQVLINLSANACDAMPDGGKVRIRTKQVTLTHEEAKLLELENGGGYAVVEFTDTGTGMDARTRERIFEPFFTTKELGKGTGLGLAIIYGIVKQHGGTITVASDAGNGTTFSIYFPLTTEAATSDAPEEEVLPPGGTETVLLAEDDMVVRTYLKKLLEMAGYSVLTAQNGEDAVAQFRENRFKVQLVICDVVMPRKNGKEVCDEVRGLQPLTKFLFISGYNDEIIHKKGILEENVDYLPKPVARKDLLMKVREILDRDQGITT